MLVVTCLTYFIHFMPILAHGYLLVILLWSFMWIQSYFASLGMVMDIIAQIHACMPCEAP
jgi:hypothetical protein